MATLCGFDAESGSMGGRRVLALRVLGAYAPQKVFIDFNTLRGAGLGHQIHISRWR